MGAMSLTVRSTKKTSPSFNSHAVPLYKAAIVYKVYPYQLLLINYVLFMSCQRGPTLVC